MFVRCNNNLWRSRDGSGVFQAPEPTRGSPLVVLRRWHATCNSRVGSRARRLLGSRKNHLNGADNAYNRGDRRNKAGHRSPA